MVSERKGQSPAGSNPSVRAAESKEPDDPSVESRRSFMSTCGTAAMVGGMGASYGTLGFCAIQYLAPDAADSNLDWQFVGTMASLDGLTSFDFTASSGVKIVIARVAETASPKSKSSIAGDSTAGAAEPEVGLRSEPVVESTGFLALSSVCPHLGCQVFWETANDRFFCPCHNGIFDATGKATGGPPADANQSLTQYPTRILNNALYVMAPLETVTDQGRSA